MKDSTNNDTKNCLWQHHTGPLPISLTNDYLFKAVNQENADALQSLLCAILHCSQKQIISTEITNSIVLGNALTEKEFRLDVKVRMNNDINIDLEMQVANYHDWPERSLQYLCRLYDSLNKGDDYIDTQTAIHIGILDFVLFKDESRLLDSYRLMNVKTNKEYTDKFQLYILCLPKVNTPDDEDRLYHTDTWAKFFSAKTWEDLKMLIKEDEGIEAAVETAEKLLSDDRIREQVLAREDYYRRVRTEQRLKQMLEDDNKKLQDANTQLQDENTQLQDANTQLQDENTQLQDANTQLQDEIAQLQQRLAELEAMLNT